MTEKLYYLDSHLFSFSATVIGCEETEGSAYLIILDKTAFFPEGGGQRADTGYIANARVTYAYERNGVIFHECNAFLAPGSEVVCSIDSEQRLRRMQNHSGEHILSGLIYNSFGYNNVGFHMGESFMTIDFSGELSDADLELIERKANEKIRDNIPVRAYFPTAEELDETEYRSKLDIKENVRLVKIEGCDICACCAPHVSYTGEIGSLKILSSMRHRGGTRMEVVCGMDALDHYRIRQRNAERISMFLSAKQNEISDAVERVIRTLADQKERIALLSMENASLKADAVQLTEGNICLFDNLLDDVALRELVNRLTEKSTGIVAVFSGNDRTGYKYIIGSKSVDLRKLSAVINSGVEGEGGGSSSMIRGSCRAGADKIRAFIISSDFIINT